MKGLRFLFLKKRRVIFYKKMLVNTTNRTKKRREIVKIEKNYSIMRKIFQKGIDKTHFMWYTMGNNYGKV